MVPSICYMWYYTSSRLVNSEGGCNFSGTRSQIFPKNVLDFRVIVNGIKDLDDNF